MLRLWQHAVPADVANVTFGDGDLRIAFDYVLWMKLMLAALLALSGCVDGNLQTNLSVNPGAFGSGWWCTSRSDGYGVCTRTPNTCEGYRMSAQPPQGMNFSYCVFQAAAVCAYDACFTTPAWCEQFKQESGRFNAMCVEAR